MNYKSKVFEYANKLDEYQRNQLVSVIKKSIEDGFSYQWIWTALQHKDKDVWAKYGYGLFLNKGFRTEINNKLIKTKDEINKETSVFSIDCLPDDNEDESDNHSFAIPSVSSVSLDAKQSAGGAMLSYGLPYSRDEYNEAIELINYERSKDSFSRISKLTEDLWLAYPADWKSKTEYGYDYISGLKERYRNINIKDIPSLSDKDFESVDIWLRLYIYNPYAIYEHAFTIHNVTKIKQHLANGDKCGSCARWYKPE